MKWLDAFSENSARALARRTSRRSVLAGLGSMLLGAGMVPLLPVARGAETKPGGAAPRHGAPARRSRRPLLRVLAALRDRRLSVRMLRRIAVDVPARHRHVAITWIGTCHNPGDSKDYVISYNDCCGKGSCGRCFCNRNEGDSALF